MKKTILFSLSLAVILASCTGKTEHTDSHEGHDMTQQEESTSTAAVSHSTSTSGIIDSYLAVKNALVADDYAAASANGSQLVTALKGLEIAEANEAELKKLQADALASAEKLDTEDPAVQRENFQALSVTLTSLLKIAGTDRTLYQQHCPMYNGTGGIWLSASEEIKNPLFGSKMLTCGKVQETLTSL